MLIIHRFDSNFGSDRFEPTQVSTLRIKGRESPKKSRSSRLYEDVDPGTTRGQGIED